jgi:hypothetical protein
MLLVEDEDDKRFMYGRKGDHLMTSFQCDLCHFRNMKRTDPGSTGKDKLLLIYIRRANLDALWSREPGTVNGNLREAARMARAAEELGISSLPLIRKATPVEDIFGMEPAVIMLRRSLDPGRNQDTIQFSTARKVRSVHSNYTHANFGHCDETVMALDDKKMHTTTAVTYSRWFERFIKGCHSRMGDQPKPDKAIEIDVLLGVLAYCDTEYKEALVRNDTRTEMDMVCLAVYVAAGFLGGLRGEEVVTMDLIGVRTHFADGLRWKLPHVTIPMYGRFKGEDGTKWLLVPVVTETKSGILMAHWMERLLEAYNKRGIVGGWVFRRWPGKAKGRISDFDPLFHDALRRVQRENPDLIKPDVDVADAYSLRRSLRRGSTTHAKNRDVPLEHIECNNRWRKQARAKGKAPSLSMSQHYTDVRGSLEYTLRYSAAL